MRSVRKVLRTIKSRSKEGYRWFLKAGVLPLFVRPEVAVSCAFSTVSPLSAERVVATALRCAASASPPSPEKVIANYLLGMSLLGRYGTDELEWRVFPERAIITPDTARIPRSTRRDMNRGDFEITRNRDFEGVLRGCIRQKWSWITEPLTDIYKELRALGVAMTLESYRDGQLVGGQLGLMVGNTFAGLSAFHAIDGAGTVIWGTMMEELLGGGFGLVDCGEMKPHFARHGAYAVPRDVFVERVVQGLIRSR